MIERLFVYGSLAPGKENAHVLADIPGDWMRASVRGHLRNEGWGALSGFPGLVLDALGAQVGGMLFSSDSLVFHWHRLDAFEGKDYQRVMAEVALGNGASVQAYVYALRNAGR